MKRTEVEQYVGKGGDMFANLINHEGVGEEHRVCDLVWEAFNGKIPNGYVVAHIDGNKGNNRLNNLKLVKNGSSIS